MNTFSISEALRFGWETFKRRPWFFIGVFIGVEVVGMIVNGVANFALEQIPLVAFLISLVVGTFVGIALVKLALQAYVNPEGIRIEDLWAPQYFLPMLGATLLMFLVVFIGLLLFIIPGIIAAIALTFTTYLVIDKSMGPIDAVKESYRISKGHWGKLFLLCLAIFGINILGMLCLLVGLLVTIPVSMFAMIYVYKKLSLAPAPAPAPMMAPPPPPSVG